MSRNRYWDATQHRWIITVPRRKGQELARTRTVAARGDVCERCGSTTNIELHHKVRMIEGGTHADDNLILLCERCHKQAHHE